MIAGATPFNADFYATAATVIPVLFLALMFPGAPLHRVLVALDRWVGKRAGQGNAPPNQWGLAFFATFAQRAVLIGLVMLGSFGELSALIALYNRHATSTESAWTLFATEVLVVAVGLSVVGSVGYAAGHGGEDD